MDKRNPAMVHLTDLPKRLPETVQPVLGPLIKLYPDQTPRVQFREVEGTRIMEFIVGNIGIRVLSHVGWFSEQHYTTVDEYDIKGSLSEEREIKVRYALCKMVDGGNDYKLQLAENLFQFSLNQTNKTLKLRLSQDSR